jgi:hypothetical protein
MVIFHSYVKLPKGILGMIPPCTPHFWLPGEIKKMSVKPFCEVPGDVTPPACGTPTKPCAPLYFPN